MDAHMKRRYAVMAAALLETDDDILPTKRRYWVKGWMQHKDRGIQNQLYEELLESDLAEYRRLLRVPHDVFVELLARIRPRIQKQTTNMRRPVSAKTRLQLTLRYMASGESHYSLSRQFRVGHSAVNGIIHSTCAVIYDTLKDEELTAPKSNDAWLGVARHFNERWQFPNCVGGIDGKHVAIIKPAKSGTVYYNYKKTYSIILFALVDAGCKFLYIDVGTPGSKGDAAIWQTTPLQKAVASKSSGLPDLVDMNTSSGLQLPPVIVGDDAFPLSPNLMKPFGGNNLTPEKKIFNYRLSRARRVTENAFGILAHRFRFLLTTVHARPERVRTMVQAACVLHNLLKRHRDHVEQPKTSKAPGKKPTFFSLRPSKARPGALAAAVRERLCDYFSGEGSVTWQNKAAGIDISHLRKKVTVSVNPGA